MTSVRTLLDATFVKSTFGNFMSMDKQTSKHVSDRVSGGLKRKFGFCPYPNNDIQTYVRLPVSGLNRCLKHDLNLNICLNSNRRFKHTFNWNIYLNVNRCFKLLFECEQSFVLNICLNLNNRFKHTFNWNICLNVNRCFKLLFESKLSF